MTRFTDLDPMNHVNNVSVLGLYQEARIVFMKILWDRMDIYRPRQVVASINVAYIREINHPTTLTIGVGVQKMGKSSYVISQACFDVDLCVGVADCTLVCTEEGWTLPREARHAMQDLSIRPTGEA